MKYSHVLFRQLLTLAVCNTFFMFNGKFYKQLDGLGMGLPLGPTFANIFLCFHEKVWLSECPLSFKPVFYRRYVDDTFVLFRDRTHVQLFLDYLNSKHRSIKFTSETEVENRLNFLDINVTRGYTFATSIHRKSSFSGLGTSFFSFCSLKTRLSSIQTLIHRAYRICSDYHSLHNEFDFLRRFFVDNGYPSFLVNKYVRRFLDNLYNSKQSVNVPSDDCCYISIPYFGYQSEKLRSHLQSLLRKFYHGINFRIILVNSFKIGSFFRYKDRIPVGMQASLVYEYSCALGCAPVSYVGSTTRHLYQRVAEHANRSARTDLLLSTPSKSSIFEHSISCGCSVTLDNFRVLGSCKHEIDLRILESLHIHKRRPMLNNSLSSFPLLLID